MSNNQFSILYDGAPVDEGTIDARDLAPALLAFAELVDQSAPFVDERFPHLTVRVRSGFEKGSFEIFLEVATLYDKFINLFTSPDLQALAMLLAMLGINGAPGLFQLIKKSKGRKPKSTTNITIEGNNHTIIIFGDDEKITVEEKVWKLFQNIEIRRTVEKILSPLNEKGFDLFKIKQNDKEKLVVTEKEAQYFVAPSEREMESTSEIETRLTIVSPSFNKWNKWRVSDGSRTIYVNILDEQFLTNVEDRQAAFRKGDILHVILRITQWIESGKLCVEYSVIKVIKHDQGKLPEKIL
jgi:hypothetical protein